jgi:AraC-like DNA-binding protein
MDDPFAVAERQVESLLEAAKTLRATLLRSEINYRRTLKSLRRNSKVTATIKANRFDASRMELTDVLKDFERQRHLTRGSVILAQLAEGESISEIARSWGFSHQLASKYAKEATNGPGR